MAKTVDHADAIVIGAGLHGCSAALFLARRGLSVIVLEKDTAGRHASGLNAGGVRRLGRALPEVPLAMASADLWHRIEELVEDDCGFRASGQVKVAETATELAALEDRVRTLRGLGFDHERFADQDTLREILPAVAPHCTGGIFVEDDGYADPMRTVRAFKQRAATLGARFMEATRVTGLTRSDGTWHAATTDRAFEAPVVLNCAGAWGGEFAALLGEPVPLRPAALMMTLTKPMPAFVTPVVGAQGRKLSLKQLDDGRVMIGGGHEGEASLQTGETRLDDDELAINVASAAAIFPRLKEAGTGRQWAGIEGMSPDGLPVVGPGSEDGIFHAFGFSAHGFQLGPVCGKILADLVVDGATDQPIEPFAISRSFADLAPA